MTSVREVVNPFTSFFYLTFTLLSLLSPSFSNLQATLDPTSSSSSFSAPNMAIPAPLRPIVGLLSYIFHMLAALVSPSTELTGPYTVHLHGSPLILYRGGHSYVHLTVSGPNVANADLKAALVRRGWRAGFVGWSGAKYLGATDSGKDVTPATRKAWSASNDSDEPPRIAPKKRQQIDAAIDSTGVESAKRQEHSTMSIRLPASEGDGYFRVVLVKGGAGKEKIYSPTFRLYSLSLSSACPRGSSILPPTLVPELLLRTISTILYAALLALSPLGFLAKYMPRGITRWIGGKVYRAAGGDAKRDAAFNKYGVQEKLDSAKSQVAKVPWASAGVRTSWDRKKDEELGVGGVRWTR